MAWRRPIVSIWVAKASSLRNRLLCASAIQNSRMLVKCRAAGPTFHSNVNDLWSCLFAPKICSLKPMAAKLATLQQPITEAHFSECPSIGSATDTTTRSSVVIEPGASLIHARLRASIAGLDKGTFTEGHELDRKRRVPKEMVGRWLWRIVLDESRRYSLNGKTDALSPAVQRRIIFFTDADLRQSPPRLAVDTVLRHAMVANR